MRRLVYKSLTFAQLQNFVYIGAPSSRWLTDFRVQMTSMVFFRYLHAYEHFEWGAKGFTQKSCNCPHPNSNTHAHQEQSSSGNIAISMRSKTSLENVSSHGGKARVKEKGARPGGGVSENFSDRGFGT